MAKYRAIRSSYGFRGTFWEMGDVAEDVTKTEAERIDVKTHFSLIKQGESDEVPPHPSLLPPEPSTLVEVQENSQKTENLLGRRSSKR